MSKENKLLLALGIINPILYYLSPYLFLIALLAEHIIILKTSNTFGEKLWKTFLLSSMYFGVQIFGLKPYDIVILLFFPIIIMKNWKLGMKSDVRKKHLIIGGVYLVYLALILVINKLAMSQILEFVRYTMAILTVVSFYLTVNKVEELSKVIEILPIYALKNFFSGFVIMLLMMYTNFSDKFSIGLIKVNIYNSLPEVRLTGFFSDPNKYFLYFVFLLIIYEFYNYVYNYKSIKIVDKVNIIFIIGAISSLSRTGIVAIVAYVVIKFINIKFFYKKQNLFLKALLGTILVIGLMLLLFPNVIIGIADKFIYAVTVLIGREESLVYSSSISQSSRIISWGVALDSVSDSLAFGNGLYSWPDFYYMPPHNTFVAIIQDTGIVGIALFLGFIIYGVINLPIHITLLLLLIPMMTFDLQNYRLLYLLVAILVTSRSEGKIFNKIK